MTIVPSIIAASALVTPPPPAEDQGHARTPGHPRHAVRAAHRRRRDRGARGRRPPSAQLPRRGQRRVPLPRGGGPQRLPRRPRSRCRAPHAPRGAAAGHAAGGRRDVRDPRRRADRRARHRPARPLRPLDHPQGRERRQRRSRRARRSPSTTATRFVEPSRTRSQHSSEPPASILRTSSARSRGDERRSTCTWSCPNPWASGSSTRWRCGCSTRCARSGRTYGQIDVSVSPGGDPEPGRAVTGG